MNLEHIFPTPIWSFEYTDTCEELIKYIQYCRKKSEGRIVSNKGGWQSEDCQASELPSCFDNLFTTGSVYWSQISYNSIYWEAIDENGNIWYDNSSTLVANECLAMELTAKKLKAYQENN